MNKEIIKGNRYSLTSERPELENILVEFDYKVNQYMYKEGEFDISTAVFLTDNSGSITSYEDFLYKDNKSHSSGCVRINDREDKVYITISKIPQKIRKIFFAISLSEKGDILRFYDRFDYISMRIIDLDREDVMYTYIPNEKTGQNTEIIFGEMYRHNGEWKFNSNTEYTEGGLLNLGKMFGLGI